MTMKVKTISLKIFIVYGSVGNVVIEKKFTASAADASKHSSQFQSIEKTEETPMFPKKLPEPPQLKEHPPSIDSSEGEEYDDVLTSRSSATRKERSASGQLSQHSKFGSRGALHSPIGSTHSFDLQVCSYTALVCVHCVSD